MRTIMHRLFIALLLIIATLPESPAAPGDISGLNARQPGGAIKPLTIPSPAAGTVLKGTGDPAAPVTAAPISAAEITGLGTLATQSGTFSALDGRVGTLESAPMPVEVVARQLKRLRAAVAATRAGTADTRLLCIGDSTTSGYGGSTTSTIPATKAYPRQLVRMLPNAAQGLANGRFDGSYQDQRWTTGPGWGTSYFGWQGYQGTSPAGTLTYAPDGGETFDRFDVFYVVNPDGGTLTATATGGSAVVINCNAATGIAKTTVSAGAAGAANALVMSAAGTVRVVGVEPWLSTKKRIRIGNVGINSTTTAWWAGVPPYSGQVNLGTLVATAAHQPHCVVLSLGLNDAAASFSPATFKANLTAIVVAIKTYADVVLWTPQPPAGPGVAPVLLAPGIASYMAIYREVAAEQDIPLVDVYSRLGGVYTAALCSDGYHANDAGYQDIAAAIASVILPAIAAEEITAASLRGAELSPEITTASLRTLTGGLSLGGRLGLGTASPTANIHGTYNTNTSQSFLLENLNGGPGAQASLQIKNNVGTTAYFGLTSSSFSGYPPLDGGRIYAGGNSTLSLFTNGAFPLIFSPNGVEAMAVRTSGVTITPQLTLAGNSLRISSGKTPASATDTGTAGEICWDSNYIYVCTAANTWKRAALATW